MTWWATTLVALGSAGVGGLLTGGASWLVFRRQERSVLARDVRMALGDYFGALVITVSHLTRMPEDAPSLDVVGAVVKQAPDQVRRWLEAQKWVSTEKEIRKVFGNDPFAQINDVIRAYAPLQILPLPRSLDAALSSSLDYVSELATNRSAEMKARWPDVRQALLDSVRAHVADANDLARALRLPLEVHGTPDGAQELSDPG